MFTSKKTSRTGAWLLHFEPPKGWGDQLRLLDGGFFHSPPGLHVGAPSGIPVYAEYREEGQVVGMATGVRATCRISLRARHAYFPTWPVFATGIDRVAATAALGDLLREHDVAEVRWDSYDARPTARPVQLATRQEYVVPLDLIGSPSVWPAASQHRRHLRRGERVGLELREVETEEAAAILAQVLAQASERGAARGVRFGALVPEVVRTNGVNAPHWGLATFAAFRGPTLCAAALIGHGPARAYYILGGATPEGYEIGASVWLHSHIAASFAARGLSEYNLGGVPASGVDPTDPAHGLHRFKVGFGSRMVPCAGERWILGALHAASHRLAGWAAGMVG